MRSIWLKGLLFGYIGTVAALQIVPLGNNTYVFIMLPIQFKCEWFLFAGVLDVKPENMILVEETAANRIGAKIYLGQVKVIGMGFKKSIGLSQSSIHTHHTLQVSGNVFCIRVIYSQISQ